MFKYLFIFFLIFSCQKKDPALTTIGIKIKPLYRREMELWIAQNSKFVTYEKPAEYYPAHLITSEKWFKGRVKLRGDLKRHWVDKDKSYRFHLKNETFRNMKEFDLVIMKDKFFEQEVFAYQLAEKFNLLVPQAFFVNLFINHQTPTPYLLIERLRPTSLKHRNLPAGDIVRESNAWLDTLYLKDKSLYKNVFYTNVAFNPLSLEPAIYNVTFRNEHSQDAFSQFAEMLKEMKVSLSNNKNISWVNYIDMDQAASWASILVLFGGHHASLGDNLRWYYNSKTKLFSPIPYDILPEKLNPDNCSLEIFKKINPWIQLWMKDKTFVSLLRSKLSILVGDNFLETEWKVLEEKHRLHEIPQVLPTLSKNLKKLEHNRRVIQKTLQSSDCL